MSILSIWIEFVDKMASTWAEVISLSIGKMAPIPGRIIFEILLVRIAMGSFELGGRAEIYKDPRMAVLKVQKCKSYR